MDAATDPTFTLTHPAEIRAVIERMRDERALTTIAITDGDAIVSQVLEVRRDANALVFDVPRDPEQNRRLFAARKLAFASNVDRVAITFETDGASPLTLPDGPAAVVTLPTAVVRLQRREWFRAVLPVRPPVRCTVLDRAGKAMSAQAIDLSPGGAALMMDDPFATGTQARGDHRVVLYLPDVGSLGLEATLRSVMPAETSPDGSGQKVRIGFRFEAVPPKTATQIQRYVQQLEAAQLRMRKTHAIEV